MDVTRGGYALIGTRYSKRNAKQKAAGGGKLDRIRKHNRDKTIELLKKIRRPKMLSVWNTDNVDTYTKSLYNTAKKNAKVTNSIRLLSYMAKFEFIYNNGKTLALENVNKPLQNATSVFYIPTLYTKDGDVDVEGDFIYDSGSSKKPLFDEPNRDSETFFCPKIMTQITLVFQEDSDEVKHILLDNFYFPTIDDSNNPIDKKTYPPNETMTNLCLMADNLSVDIIILQDLTEDSGPSYYTMYGFAPYDVPGNVRAASDHPKLRQHCEPKIVDFIFNTCKDLETEACLDALETEQGKGTIPLFFEKSIPQCFMLSQDSVFPFGKLSVTS